MIVHSCFPGDNNQTVKKVQEIESEQMVWHLFEMSKLKYAKHNWYALLYPKLLDNLMKIETIDSNILSGAHNLIAGAFRYLFCLHEEKKAYPYGFAYALFYLEAWRKFYQLENHTISLIRKFQNSIILTVAFSGDYPGNEAKVELNDLLKSRYPFLDHENCN